MFFDIFTQLCHEAGLSLNGAAKELGFSSGSITAWKSGIIPKYRALRKIADYFDVSLDYLLGKTNIKKPPVTAGDITFDDFTYAMHNESKELTESQKDQLLAMARFFKSELDKEKQDN